MKNKKMDKKMLLSTLWIFVTLNYLYCDIMGLMDATLLKQYLTGNVGGMAISEKFLLGAAIFMEIPIIMVLLSRILRNKVNSYANITAGTIMTLVQSSTLLVGSPTKYYVFCSTIEIAATLFIIWYAWKWKNLKEPNK